MKKHLTLLTYLATAHLGGLVCFMAFRLCFFFSLHSALAAEATSAWPAFLRGLWLDNVIGSYILLLPLLVLLVAQLCGCGGKGLLRFLNIWMGGFYTLAFAAAAANIPFYNYFNQPLNSTIWQWAAYPSQTLGMLFGEATWWKYIALWVVVTAVYAYGLFRWRQYFLHRLPVLPKNWRARGVSLLLWLPIGGLCVLGARGRLGYNPIKISAAYYCDNADLNNLGVNATFNLLNSTLDDARKENRPLQLMDENAALVFVRQDLGRSGLPGISPLAQIVRPEGEPRYDNVVVVFMESMSTKFMGTFGNPSHLTPTLDSLFAEGLSFENCYSAGNHTNQGVYATLYGFPAQLKRNMMRGSVVPRYAGLPTVLREKGYQTLFFIPHEGQYDNMNAFLRTNGFAEVYAQEDYPRDKVVNHFGVSDDYLFSYALPVINRRARSGKPFFATILTVSNHPPYIIPPYFHPKSKQIEDQIVEYADWSIGKFMAEARKQPWFAHTLFVFVGDHGKRIEHLPTDGLILPESCNHVPLIIYGVGLPREQRKDFAGQVDIAPTILGLLRLPYVQNNLGVDLTTRRREAIFYSADNVVAARNAEYLYLYSPDAERAYTYAIDQGKYRPIAENEATRKLRMLVFANLQTAAKLVREKQTIDRKAARH